jgi:hypothetical protein
MWGLLGVSSLQGWLAGLMRRYELLDGGGLSAAGRARREAAVWGWAEDQRWTLARVTALMGRLFHVRYTLRGTS